MQPTGLERLVEPNGAPRTSNDEHRSTGFIIVSHSPVLRNTLQQGNTQHQKTFLRSFIKRIGIQDNEAQIEYTCPIGLSSGRRSEVLSIVQIGDPDRTIAKTFKLLIRIGPSFQNEPYSVEIR